MGMGDAPGSTLANGKRSCKFRRDRQVSSPVVQPDIELRAFPARSRPEAFSCQFGRCSYWARYEQIPYHSRSHPMPCARQPECANASRTEHQQCQRRLRCADGAVGFRENQTAQPVGGIALLACDEVTGGLDCGAADDNLTLLRTLNRIRGRMMVIVAHYSHAAEVANHTLRLDKGQLAEQKVH